jgi:isoleucyl-tRNA synthetase
VDYREDMRFSEDMLPRLSEAYRKVRNTCRYLLSNLYDFDPRTASVPADRLDDVDAYALARHRQVVQRVLDAYRDYEFHVVYHQLVQYCAVDLSSFYLDVLKDRLYCDPADGPRRRSAQTVMHTILSDLVRLMAPALPFTAEEVWEHLPARDADSVHMTRFPEGGGQADLGAWPALLETRALVTKALEEARAAKAIASSLEARVEIRGAEAALAPLRRFDARGTVFPGNLANLFIVSGVTLVPGDGALAVTVAPAAGTKCERCWTYSINVGRFPVHPGVCERCADALERTGVARTDA